MMHQNPALRDSWSGWAEFLRRHGLEDLAVWTLEASGPLKVLGAQFVYLGEPLMRPAFSNGQMKALAHLLEDDGEAMAFASYLRKEEQA